MNYKYVILIYIFSSILYTQENIPFDVSKQFAVPIENNQLLWNDDKSFNKLLIDRSSRNFKNKFTNLDFEELPEDSSYVKSKFIYELTCKLVRIQKRKSKKKVWPFLHDSRKVSRVLTKTKTIFLTK